MKLLSIITLMMALISCSKKSSYDEDSSLYYPQSFSSLEQELKSTDFNCDSSDQCPENVGLIYMNTNGSDYSPQIGRCTGFLVQDNIVGTNSHCIPDHLRGYRNSCSGQIAIRFMNKGSTNVFDCVELLDNSPLGVYDADYAFFKIKSTGIKPLTISQSGIKDNQNISIARVTPSRSTLGGTLSVDSCRVALGSLLNLKATNSWAETGLAVDCEAIPGNSGSPVLDSSGKVIGILQSKMRSQFLANLESSFKKFGLELPDQVKPHFIFTNLSCIESEGILQKQSKCESGKKLAFTSCLEMDEEENEKRGARVVDVWKNELPDIFVYKFVTNIKDGGSINAEPLCIKNSEQVSSYKSFVKKKGVIGFRRDHLNLNYYRTMKLGAKFSVDEDLRLQPTMDFIEQFRSEYNVDLKLKNNTWEGTFNSTLNQRGIDLSQVKLPLKVTSCTQAQIDRGNLSYVKMLDGSLLTEKEYIEQRQKKSRVKCEK